MTIWGLRVLGELSLKAKFPVLLAFSETAEKPQEGKRSCGWLKVDNAKELCKSSVDFLNLIIFKILFNVGLDQKITSCSTPN